MNKRKPQNKTRSQVEVTPTIVKFLGDLPVKSPQDLVTLRNKITDFLTFRPYNNDTKQHADSI